MKSTTIQELSTDEIVMVLYADATAWAMEHNQVVGENRDYYVTLAQLEAFIKKYQTE